MAAAQGVLDNPNATQDEVNAAYEALVRAYLDLRLIPNKDLLEDLINKVETLNAANYTADSWAVLMNDLTNARSVLANENVDDATVKAAVESLQASMDALVNVNSNVTAGDKVSTGDTTSIATGDSTSMLSSIAGLALASIAMFGAKRRKKSK